MAVADEIIGAVLDWHVLCQTMVDTQKKKKKKKQQPSMWQHWRTHFVERAS